MTSINYLICQEDSIKPVLKSYTEVSFGQSLLFISNSKAIDLKNEAAIVVPTSSVLMFAEFRTMKKLRIPVFFNYPTETKQFLVDGVLINEKANPTLWTGLSTGLLKIKTNEETYFEIDAGAVVTATINIKDKLAVARVLVGRLRMIRNNSFTMYFGLSYTFGLNTTGMFYG